MAYYESVHNTIFGLSIHQLYHGIETTCSDDTLQHYFRKLVRVVRTRDRL